MKKVSVMLFAVLVAGSATASAAGNADAGKEKANTCMACHGPTGVSPNNLWPNLAAQGDAYIVKQLKAFRDGTRKDPVMEPMAKPLSDEEIENLAAYFSTQASAPVRAP